MMERHGCARVQGERSIWDVYDAVVAACDVPPTPTRLDDWQSKAEELRSLLFEKMGVVPRFPAPVVAKTLGVTEFEGYSVERVVYDSLPDFPVTANLYLPNDLEAPAPGIVCPHGHSDDGKAFSNYQALYIGLAKLGFVVLAPDGIGKGERRALGHGQGRIGPGSAWLIGSSLMGMQIWDNIKGIDVLCNRKEVDPNRIGCAGYSGGGAQTIWTAALDPRISVAVAGGAATSLAYHHSKERDFCLCNVNAGILPHTEMHHVLGLIAPRPFAFVEGRQDNMIPWDLQRETVRRARRFYRLFGEDDAIQHVVTPEGHEMSQGKREAYYRFFLHHLRPNDSERDATEPTSVQPLDPNDPALVCFPQIPPELSRELQWYVTRDAERMLANWTPPESPAEWTVFRSQYARRLRSLLLRSMDQRDDLIDPRGASVSEEGDVTRVTLWTDPWTPVQGVIAQPSQPSRGVRIVVDDAGTASAWARQAVKDALAAGYTAFAIDLRGWGALTPMELAADGSLDERVAVQKGLGYDVPLMGLRVADLLASCEWAAGHVAVTRVEVVGRHLGALVCLMAAVLDDGISRVVLDELPMTLIPPSDSADPARLFTLVPNLISDVGDIPQLLGLIAPRACDVRYGAASPSAFVEDVVDHWRPTQASYRSARAPEALVLRRSG